ncbi:MAG: FAD binding domain-containing protein, partial [Desulfitobacteriaceae bacterium]
QGSSFQKLGKRKALAISVVNAAVFIEIDSKTRTIREARIALGSVAPTPIRVKRAENLLLGKILSAELLKQVRLTVASEVKPIDDIRAKAEYRRDVAGELVERAVQEAWNKASFLG